MKPIRASLVAFATIGLMVAGGLTSPWIAQAESVAISPIVVAVGAITGLGTGMATWLATPSSANLRGTVTDETGTSGGLVFAGTPTLITPVLGAATATSVNFGGTTLSTYAEGTWTPAILFGGAAVGVTYGAQTGRYTEIGRLVCVEGIISLTSKGSSTGSATITGLPFTVNAIGPAASVVPNGTSFLALTAGIAANFGASGTTIILRAPGTTGAGAMTDTNFTNTSTMQIAGCYSV